MFLRKMTIALFLIFTSCQKYFISIVQDRVDGDSLASAALYTPDPRAQHPPLGERLIVEWQLPRECVEQHPKLYLYVVYKDYTKKEFIYDITHRVDYIVYQLLGDAYCDTRGVLAYKAEVKLPDGTIFRTWQHQLWVEPIIIEDSSA